MKKVLVLEDESSIRSFIVINLRRAGYEVVEAETGEEALEKLKEHTDVRVALLDIMLPGIDGFEVCRRIRMSNSQIGIIMLTARTQEMDKVTGLMTGADDYVTKPFSPAELLARVDALYRRIGGSENTEDVLSSGPFVLHLRSRTLDKNSEHIRLTQTEFAIMKLFMENPGRALSREDILHAVWGADYNGEVKIVDEFTGRIMEGRRYSEGLHQAIEAKEGVLVREENQTLATITLQNYFRLYDKLSGMTGTALTEDAEFREIYKLPVEVIPSNKPVQRVDHEDLVYRTIQAKYNAVADDVERRHAKGQPVLVGTVSIESSEKLSAALTKRGIAHEVLNAKHHEREAHIVAQAGRYGAVTIATNMAGRGTDILLGGNPDELVRERLEYEGLTMEDVTPEQLEQFNAEAKETCKAERERVLAAGGLTVIGTERHESRRIDNQLRGRSGRQGDPGETQFYLSLEDDLMRLFGGDRMDRVSKMMVTADMGDDMPIQHKIISKAVESAQHKVESINFSMRKSVLEYDDVMNKQRQVIYAERNKILDGKDLTDHITEVMHDTVYRCVQEFCTKDSHEGERDLEGLRKWVVELTGHIDTPQFPDEDFEALAADVLAYVEKCYNMKAERLGEDLMRELNTQVMLRVIDTRWMNYLQEMDYLKTGIGLRGFGQRDPLVEYKTEAYGAFHILVDTMYEDYLRTVLRIEIKAAPRAVEHKEEPALEGAHFSGPAEVDGDNGGSVLRKQAQVQARTAVQGGPAAVNNGGKVTTYRKSESDDPYVNVGRNDPCPCGSGKKFKYCHGRNR